MKAPVILDTTLRDGEQSPGVYFTRRDKLYVAKELDEMGIAIIEAGIPVMGPEEQHTLKLIRKTVKQARVLSWNRLLPQDVEASFRADVWTVHVSAPASDVMLEGKLGRSRSWLLSQIEKTIRFACDRGAEVSFGAEDASRSDLAFLANVFMTAQQLGAVRVRYADTLGLHTPRDVQRRMDELAPALQIPIDFHGHNDFGMATANALTAWESGAGVISCSVLGLGERAGNTSLEEFSAILAHLKDVDYCIDFKRLKSLGKRVARITQTPIPGKHPIIGDRIFTHESGIHVDGLLKNPLTYELLSPELLGGKRTIIAGKHSGGAAIQYLARQAGYTLSEHAGNEFIVGLRRQMNRQRGVDASRLLNAYLKKHAKPPSR
ncbi:MAG: hypothetical protein QM786_16340 [Breznakibacter sp.]